MRVPSKRVAGMIVLVLCGIVDFTATLYDAQAKPLPQLGHWCSAPGLAAWQDRVAPFCRDAHMRLNATEQLALQLRLRSVMR